MTFDGVCVRWLSKMSPTSSSVSSGIIRRRGSEVELSAIVVVVSVVFMCVILLGLYFFYRYLGTLHTASHIQHNSFRLPSNETESETVSSVMLRRVCHVVRLGMMCGMFITGYSLLMRLCYYLNSDCCS